MGPGRSCRSAAPPTLLPVLLLLLGVLIWQAPLSNAMRWVPEEGAGGVGYGLGALADLARRFDFERD